MRSMLLFVLVFVAGCYAEGEITAKIEDIDVGAIVEGPVVGGRKLPDYKRTLPTRYFFEVKDYECGDLRLIEVSEYDFDRKEVGNWYRERGPYR